jgi:hypothetical protein
MNFIIHFLSFHFVGQKFFCENCEINFRKYPAVYLTRIHLSRVPPALVHSVTAVNYLFSITKPLFLRNLIFLSHNFAEENTKPNAAQLQKKRFEFRNAVNSCAIEEYAANQIKITACK